MEESLRRSRTFMNKLETLQFEYFDGRPEWIELSVSNLGLYMAITYFGHPKIASDTDNENYEDSDMFQLYENEEKYCINDMVKIIQEKIIGKTTKVEVGFTMVHSICQPKCASCTSDEELNAHVWYLLRIKKIRSVAYIDLSHKSTYKDFNDYIENNELPSGFMFYPKSGMYEESNYLDSKLTPPSRKGSLVLNILDTIGQWLTCSAGLVLGAGLFFPAISPVLFTTAAVVSSSACGYDVVRQSSKLASFAKHNISLKGRKAMDHWINVVISALGVITSPASAVEKCIGINSISVLRAGRVGKSISTLYKGAYIAQFALQLIRSTRQVLNEGNGITLKNLISLRLDLFVVVGSLLPTNVVQQFLEVMLSVAVGYGSRILVQLPDLAYCVSRFIMRAPCFVHRHFAVFVDKLRKFVSKNLTVDKMLVAWKVFRQCMDEYRKLWPQLRGPELLHHVVHDRMTLSCDAEAKQALCGDEMTELLNALNASDHPQLVEFCVRHVLNIADGVRKCYRESVSELTSRGISDLDAIDAEFCRQYGLTACRFDQFVLHGIRTVRNAGLDEFWAAYDAETRTVRDEILVAAHRDGPRTLDAFITAVSPSVSADFCRQFASSVDPANHAVYTSSQHLSLSDDTSVLFTASAYSVRMVLFTVDSSAGRSPSLNISIYSDSSTSCNRELKFGV